MQGLLAVEGWVVLTTFSTSMWIPIATAALLAAGSGLDHASIRELYAQGDLEKAGGILEDFQRARHRYSRADSLFLYKYLGAIRSHSEETRERGKAYFHKLLRADPDARILDMPASAAVQETFQDAREELEAGVVPPEDERVVARFVTTYPAGGKRPSPWSGTGRTWVWVGAAGLGLTGAVIGYHYMVDDEVPKDKVISLDD